MFIKSPSHKLKIYQYFFLLTGIVLGELPRFRVINNVFISILDLSVLVFTLPAFLEGLLKKNTPLNSYIKWSLLVFVAMIFTLIVHANNVPQKDILTALLYPLRWLFYVFIPVQITILSKEKDNNWLWNSYYVVFISLALLGFLQLLLFPNLGIIEQYGFDPHYLRLVSTWLDPNFTGPAFVLGLLITSARHKSYSYSALITTILFLALLATFSRSSYLLFAISSLSFALMRKSWKLAALAFLGVTLLYFSFAIPRQNLEKSRNIDRIVSASSRLDSYSIGLRIFESHPLFGAGFNLIRYEKARLGILGSGGNSGAGIDSSWILVLATMGITGFLLFLSYWIRILYLVIEPASSHDSRLFRSISYWIFHASAEKQAFLAFFLGWSIHTWFVNSLFFAPLLALWGVGVGLVFVQKRI